MNATSETVKIMNMLSVEPTTCFRRWKSELLSHWSFRLRGGCSHRDHCSLQNNGASVQIVAKKDGRQWNNGDKLFLF